MQCKVSSGVVLKEPLPLFHIPGPHPKPETPQASCQKPHRRCDSGLQLIFWWRSSNLLLPGIGRSKVPSGKQTGALWQRVDHCIRMFPLLNSCSLYISPYVGFEHILYFERLKYAFSPKNFPSYSSWFYLHLTQITVSSVTEVVPSKMPCCKTEFRQALAAFLKKKYSIASGADVWTAYILPVEYLYLICVPLII